MWPKEYKNIFGLLLIVAIGVLLRLGVFSGLI